MDTPPNCHAQYKNYKIDSNVDIDVSQFFRTVPAINWRFRNFSQWYQSQSPTARFRKITTEYKKDLEKIKNHDNLPLSIKRYAGRLLHYIKTRQSIDDSKESKGTQQVNENNIFYGNSVYNKGVYNDGDTFNLNISNRSEIESKVIPAKRKTTATIPTGSGDTNHTEPDDTNQIESDDTNPTPNESDDSNHIKSNDTSPCHTETDTTIITDVQNYELHTLFECAYALYKNDYKYYKLINQFKYIQPTTTKDIIYNCCIKKMKEFSQLNKLELILLSGIINTININHQPFLESYITRQVLDDIVDKHKLYSFNQLDDVPVDKLLGELKNAYFNDRLLGLRKIIYEKKLEFIKTNHNHKSSTIMMTLDIYEHILNMVQYSSWDKESEITYVEYWKYLMKTIFRDTDIKVKIGELACEATKIERQINELEYGSTSKYIMGRKIDILLTCDANDSIYELSSCEFKPDTATDITTAIQLNKNIRINKSILTRILSCIPDENTYVIALDVKGLLGFFYSVKIYDDVVAAVKISNEQLFLPGDEYDLDDFMKSSTLIANLFNFKKHILTLSHQLHIHSKRKIRQQMANSYSRSTTTSSTDSIKTISVTPTFFTPMR